MTDAISRSAVHIVINSQIFDTEYPSELDELERLINELPALDVAPVVHAWWILKHVGVGHYWECSACRTNPCIYVTENTKFCPNCGARMDGEENAAD